LTSGGGRRRSRGQRLLYFFRTPPGIRVGRAPIDEDAIRLLEEHNPGVQFDWTRILKQPPETTPQVGGPQEQGRREDRRGRLPVTNAPVPVTSSPSPVSSSKSPVDSGSDAEDAAPDDGVEVMEFAESADVGDAAQPGEPEPVEPAEPVESLDPVELLERVDALEPVEPLVAGNRPMTTDDEPLPAGDWQQAADVDVAPRYARLGAEGLARLRARYAEVMARIAEKPVEESVKEELRAKAQRLNPDAWVTEEEVAAALEQYETVFEAIRPQVGRSQRRRRRRRV
jgi:hypothetical protein